MRVNTRKAFDAWKIGKRAHPANAIWTDGARLFSYATEIARVNGDEIAFNRHRYSTTTTIQQNGLLSLMDEMRRPVRIFDDESEYMRHVNS